MFMSRGGQFTQLYSNITPVGIIVLGERWKNVLSVCCLAVGRPVSPAFGSIAGLQSISSLPHLRKFVSAFSVSVSLLMRYESGCVNVVNVEERDVWGCCCNLRRGSRRKDVQGPRQIWRVSLVRILRLCSIPFTLWVPEIAERKKMKLL